MATATKLPISADSHIVEPPNCYTDYIDPSGGPGRPTSSATRRASRTS